MKRFYKICTAMIFIFLIAGLGFLTAAWKSGAAMPAFLNNMIQEFRIEGAAPQYNFDSKGIQCLEIDIRSGNLKIEQGTGSQILLKNNGHSWIRARMKNDGETLKIDEGGIMAHLLRFRQTKSTAVLTLPADMDFNELKIDCGSGNVAAQVLSGNEAKIDCGSGTVAMDSLIGKDVSIDCGSGEVKIGFLDADTIENELGSGDLTLVLTGKEKDYSYEIDCGSGNVQIGSRNYSGANTSYEGSGGFRDLELDSGSGHVRIDFKDDK